MKNMGKMGTNELGWPPFWFVTDVVTRTTEPNLMPGFSFMSMGCFEFIEESAVGIDWFRWLEYKCETVEVRYRGLKNYKVWLIAPVRYFEEAATEITRWVNEEDLNTNEDTTFAICLHEGLNEFQNTVAWWSISDGVIFTLQEDIAQKMITTLNDAYAAKQKEERELFAKLSPKT